MISVKLEYFNPQKTELLHAISREQEILMCHQCPCDSREFIGWNKSRWPYQEIHAPCCGGIKNSKVLADLSGGKIPSPPQIQQSAWPWTYEQDISKAQRIRCTNSEHHSTPTGIPSSLVMYNLMFQRKEKNIPKITKCEGGVEGRETTLLPDSWDKISYHNIELKVLWACWGQHRQSWFKDLHSRFYNGTLQNKVNYIREHISPLPEIDIRSTFFELSVWNSKLLIEQIKAQSKVF